MSGFIQITDFTAQLRFLIRVVVQLHETCQQLAIGTGKAAHFHPGINGQCSQCQVFKYGQAVGGDSLSEHHKRTGGSIHAGNRAFQTDVVGNPAGNATDAIMTADDGDHLTDTQLILAAGLFFHIEFGGIGVKADAIHNHAAETIDSTTGDLSRRLTGAGR